MKTKGISFVKGHCGWDIVTLLVGEQIPPGKEIETALKIISPPVSGGIEVGFMYQTDEGEDIRLRIVDSTMKQQDIEEGLYSILYDLNAEGPGQARAFSRFYEKTPSAISMPWEFQCGTGTVAVGIAMAEQGKLPFKGDKGKVVFEWGSQKLTPDSYGIRTSELNIVLEEKQIVSASFSHSVIEILCEGQLTVPGC